MTQLPIGLLPALAPVPEDAVEAAKRVVALHERVTAAADFDGIMANVSDDVVVLVPGTPLVKGKEACRELYKNFLSMGRWAFRHEHEGATATGDVVILHGVSRGTLTPAGAQPSGFANNFVLVLRRQADGKFRFWRIAVASSSK